MLNDIIEYSLFRKWKFSKAVESKSNQTAMAEELGVTSRVVKDLRWGMYYEWKIYRIGN